MKHVTAHAVLTENLKRNSQPSPVANEQTVQFTGPCGESANDCRSFIHGFVAKTVPPTTSTNVPDVNI
jgi:hypothetical protein